jgi:hypothetical protein
VLTRGVVNEKNIYHFSIPFFGCISFITPIIFTINFLPASNCFGGRIFLFVFPCIPFDPNNQEEND